MLSLLLAFLFDGCYRQNWEKSTTGIIISLKGKTGHDTRRLKVEVFSENIMHVVASPEKGFSKEESLIVIAAPRSVPSFDVKEWKDSLVVSTSEIKAAVSLLTGQVIFYDKDYKRILTEPDGGGRSFSPFSVEGTDGYSMRQVFESPVDEAFYGLGQHQSDEFNYKGLNESLYQYNTKVSVPFIVSDKNYGLHVLYLLSIKQ